MATKKEIFLERFNRRHPDLVLGDDEDAWYEQLGKDFDEDELLLSKYREADQQLSDVFSKNPKATSFFMALRDGVDPIVALIEAVGMDELRDALDDEDKLSELQAAHEKYMSRLAAESKHEEDYERNLSASFEVMSSLVAEGYSEDDVDAAVKHISEVSKRFLQGIVAREDIMMALKALHHDVDVDAARREGEVKGRNEKITEELRRSGDGAPMLGSSHVAASSKRRPSIFDQASLAR